jgi:TolA-binding protein
MKAKVTRFRRAEAAFRPLVALGAAVALSVGVGCAYFNTLYNAKKSFREAQETPRVKDGSVSGQAQERYKVTIEKCEALIASYPKSKYVDDAVLLIGKCLYEQGEYGDAIARLDQLKTVSDDNDLKREGRLYEAKSYAGKGDLEAVVLVAEQLVDEDPKKATDETYFLLGTSLVKLEKEAEAVKYLEMLAERYPKSPYRVRADLEAAEVYAEREEYERSVDIYTHLESAKLPENERIRLLAGLGRVYTEMGEFQKAIVVLRSLDEFVLDLTERATNMLVMARAYAGLDSLDAAINTYREIGVSYPRSMYSAEAHYRLGEIYQDRLDSLDVARQEFDEVPQHFAQSEFAEDAISRSAAISKLVRLRESLAAGVQGDQQVTQFDLAEIELFQFKNYTKALEGYQKLLAEYPDGDYAPRAAYAIAYIYEVHLQDAEKARAAYEHVVSRYPHTQQARYAGAVLGIEMEPIPADSTATASAFVDTTRMKPVPADSTSKKSAPADTARTKPVPADSTSKKSAPADTARTKPVPADSTSKKSASADSTSAETSP